VPRIELLVIQPTPFCNIDCRYCYLPDRNSKAVVASSTLLNLFSQVFASGWLQDCLSVVWHAGEQCEYFSVCGGGEPVNKLAENGTFVSTETTYCRLTKKRATDLVLDALERVQPSAPNRNTPDAAHTQRSTLADDQGLHKE
jgi:sulfatase maturation enzyme AslB (radical SAM superfamily)